MKLMPSPMRRSSLSLPGEQWTSAVWCSDSSPERSGIDTPVSPSKRSLIPWPRLIMLCGLGLSSCSIIGRRCVPISAVIGKAAIMDAPPPGGLGGTFAGSPLGCAAGLATLDVIRDENLVERARTIGDRMVTRLKAMQARMPCIGEVRGLGAMVAIELVKNRDANAPDAELTKALTQAARTTDKLIAGEARFVRAAQNAELDALKRDQLVVDLTPGTWGKEAAATTPADALLDSVLFLADLRATGSAKTLGGLQRSGVHRTLVIG